jgi:hypothetical protein
VLFEYGTGCEWHPSNQTLQCPARLAWCLTRRGWNLRTWHKIHWSDESRFLLHVTNGRMRVWNFGDTKIQPIPQGTSSQLSLTVPVYDGLTCPKYAVWDSSPGSWLAKEHKSRLRFGDRRLLLLNDEAWCCHPYT